MTALLRTVAIEVPRFALRLALSVLAVAFLTIVAIDLSIPGGFQAVVLPNGVNPDSPRDQALVEQYRLDDNAVERVVHWAGDLIRGDLGQSLQRNAPVEDLIWPKLPISLQLTLVAVGGAVLLGIPLGLLAAMWSQRRSSLGVNLFLGLSQTVPVFITPIFLVWIFAIELQWLPAAGWTRLTNSFFGNLENLVLPATALILAELGAIGRMVRADALLVMQQDFVAAAVAKGLSRREIALRHVLRPASLGVLNVIGLTIGALLSGTIIIEDIFGIGGLGQQVFRASIDRDLYLLLALTTYLVTVYVTLSAIVDWTMRWLDPRIGERRRMFSR